MSKISIIIQREYLTRVKKKSFIIMTLLAPLLMAAMFIVPVWIMTRDDAEEKVIAVVEDETNMFKDVIPNSQYLKFEYLEDATLDDLKTNFSDKGYYAVLYISPKVAYIPNAVQLISHKQPPLDLTIHIANALEKEIEQKKLETYDIKDLDKILKAVSTNIHVQTIKISDDGTEKETSTGLAMGIAYIGGLLIYILTFIFGAQVMRGVIEEKTSRVVEVIISSVRPFQLMMGKILGIGLVGLTQFVLWIIITGILITAAQSFLLPDDIGQTTQAITENIMSSSPVEQTQVPVVQTQEFNEIQQVFNSLHNINWGLILSSFLFYFLGGYFLYASLFAAVGSAVDNETDT
ncbi:MAG: ABC transporter permease, partial [Bacteroidetes bacterium]|nr:ABC transporter permease [Bacteroidota bacterium]